MSASSQLDSAFINAAAYGHLDIVEHLYPKINSIDTIKLAFQFASKQCRVDVIKYLINNRNDILFNKNYALVRAAYVNNLDLVKYLLQVGAQIDETDYGLHFVRKNGIITHMCGPATCFYEEKLDTKIIKEINKFNNRIIRTKCAAKN